jgi:hypothetical protein
MKAKLDIAAAEQQLNQINEEMERFWNNLIITWQNPLLNSIPEEAVYATLDWGI